MRIQENDIVRDMTPEEINALDNADQSEVEAGPNDYENALAEMGVDFSD